MFGGTVKRSRSGARFCVLLALAAAAAIAPRGASAADFELTAAVGLDTNGTFRGSKSSGFRPASHAYVELVRGEMLAGVFANPVKIQGENRALLLTYASWKPSARKFDLEVGGRYYAFPASSEFTYDFDRDGVVDHSGRKGLFEAVVGVRRKFKRGRLHLRGFYTPDNFAETGPAWYLNGEARVALVHGFETRAAVGYSGFAEQRFNENYVDYRIGINKSALGFDMYVRYSDTAGLSGADNSAIIFGVERSFTLAASPGADDRFEKIRNDWLIDKSLLGVFH